MAYSFLDYNRRLDGTVYASLPPSDWAIFKLPPTHILSNRYSDSLSGNIVTISRIAPEEEMLPGAVRVLCGIHDTYLGFLTQTSSSIHTAVTHFSVFLWLFQGQAHPASCCRCTKSSKSSKRTYRRKWNLHLRPSNLNPSCGHPSRSHCLVVTSSQWQGK
jgi:hypothetical protein